MGDYDVRLFCAVCGRLVAVVEVRGTKSGSADRRGRRCQCEAWPNPRALDAWRELLETERIMPQVQSVIFA